MKGLPGTTRETSSSEAGSMRNMPGRLLAKNHGRRVYEGPMTPNGRSSATVTEQRPIWVFELSPQAA